MPSVTAFWSRTRTGPSLKGVGTGQAMLGVYDLSTGNRIEMIDLASTIEGAPADMGHFANDVAVAADGTAYVTDTFAGVIYRVDADYQAEVTPGN